MIFGGMQKSSTIDFPGNLCAVLFTKGCNQDCFYCHNRALLTGSGPSLSGEEVEAFLQKRRGLLDGIVVSGGEPTLQPDLAGFLARIRALGYRTKLDTNGSNPGAVHALLEANLLDYAAVDYKAAAEEYVWVAGDADGNAHARETLRLLAESGISYEARTTLYPGLTAEGLLALAASLPPQLVYRLNIFRMPEMRRPQDALHFRRAALSVHEVEALLPRLREVQPGAVIA